MAPSKFSSWLITGASSGFGQSIGLVALAAGHKVVGATRNIAKAKQQNPEFEKKGGVWLELDPGSPNSGPLFAKAQKDYNVDVLVNNAGYAFIGGVEDTRLVDSACRVAMRICHACSFQTCFS
jgi:NADP-dependent 3-hydroxy acid dehydrogenase YdfG